MDAGLSLLTADSLDALHAKLAGKPSGAV
jgi:hypothetical protein